VRQVAAVRRAPKAAKQRLSPMQGLRARLGEAEATLEAIRTGAVDAVVVSGPGGARTLALEGATHPYYELLDAMSDGAAFLHADGTILFGNHRLGEMARLPIERLTGTRLQSLLAPAGRQAFEAFLRNGAERSGVGEFALGSGGEGTPTPVRIALSAVPLGARAGANDAGTRSGAAVLMAILTDLTERKRAEAERRDLIRRLITAEDEERRRIARELHDETGQSLTALLVGLRAIEEQAITLDVKAAAQRLRGVAARTVDDVGRLARGLHPSVLDDLGFVAAARRHVSDYATSFGIAVDLRLEGIASLGLNPAVQTTLYRVLQEALTNVARYAQARAVTVEVGFDGTTLELVVRDDGVGFDAAAVGVQSPGLGLHGIRERAALLGGSVAITSSPGHGTTVHARIPAGVALPPTQPAPAPRAG
jgi:signal transduction histidine kinase